MSTKADIIAGVEMIIREGLRCAEDFGPDDWGVAVHDEPDGWTRKQAYSHLVAIAEITPGFIGNIANTEEGEDAGAGFDIGEFNAQQVAAKDALSTDELLKSLESAYRGVIGAVEEMPDEHLGLKRRFGGFEGTVGDMIMSVLILHGLTHIYISSQRAFS